MKTRKLTALLLALCMLLSLSISAFAADDAVASGTIPDSKITWELDGKGWLTISGSGDCSAFASKDDQPWAEYAIGQAEPVAVEIDTQESGYYDDAFLTEAVRRVFDFTPAGMIRALDLDKPFFAEVCNNCHFMHPQAAWEQMDKAEKLRMACAELEDERT